MKKAELIQDKADDSDSRRKSLELSADGWLVAYARRRLALEGSDGETVEQMEAQIRRQRLLDEVVEKAAEDPEFARVLAARLRAVGAGPLQAPIRGSHQTES